MLTEEAKRAEETLIHVLWINAGLSCDGDSVALTAATQPGNQVDVVFRLRDSSTT